MEDLKQLIRTDAKELELQFERATTQGRGTPQEISDFRENAVQGFLANYFPFPYRIAKGGILDHTNTRSASIDCILVNPNHPYTIDRREKFKVILADGVDAAIEVKPDISQTSELYRGLKQGVSVKELRRANSPILLKRGKPQELIDYSLRVPFFVFAMKAKKNILDTATEILDFYKQEGVQRLDQADAIIVNGEGIIANYPVEGRFNWQAMNGPSTTGWFFENWRDDTLAGLLFKLTHAFSAASIQAPILTHYFKFIQLYGLIPLGTPVHD
jgi:hypothetical protein